MLSLTRGTRSWFLQPVPHSFSVGAITSLPDLFDRIDVEAGENSATDVDHTLIAEGFSPDRLAFTPGGGLTDLDGKPLVIPLGSARYAIDFEINQTYLSAHFPVTPIWFRADPVAMQVGDVRILAPFEVDAIGNSVTTLKCAPVLLQVAAPLSGDLTAKPLRLPGAPRLNFAAVPANIPGWGVLCGSSAPSQPRVSLPGFTVAVLRPSDLLSLEFDFLNLTLEGGAGIKPRLVRIDPAKDAFLICRFNAPQNIAEQAFLETAVPPPVTNPPVAALAAKLRACLRERFCRFLCGSNAKGQRRRSSGKTATQTKVRRGIDCAQYCAHSLHRKLAHRYQSDELRSA